EGGSKSGKIVKGEGGDLEAPGSRTQPPAVVRERADIRARDHPGPADQHRLESFEEFAADVDETGTESAAQPFVPPRGKDVDMHGGDVDRNLPHRLDPIHHEVNPALPAQAAETRDIGTVAGGELHR